jgi:hypothetical protein
MTYNMKIYGLKKFSEFFNILKFVFLPEIKSAFPVLLEKKTATLLFSSLDLAQELWAKIWR